MSRSEDSIRPLQTNNSVEVGDGLGVEVGRRRRGVGARGARLCATFADACPCCPIAQDDARVEGTAAVAPNVDEPPIVDEMIASEEQEPAAMPLVLPSVYQPTRSEYLDHCVTHFPFRAWCKHCLEGRGREFGHEHSRGAKDSRSTPVVSFDYCFIGDHGEIKDEMDFEAAGDGAAKLLVARDSKSKAVFAWVVPVKGIDSKGFAVKSLVDAVWWLGYTKVALKSDNEPAIVKLLKEALRELRVQGLEQCLEEHPPEYDPQANGSAEVGVKLVKGHLRTMRSCLESQIGFQVPVRHPLISWMVRHVADWICWNAKGHDGQTAYQRVKGRDFRTRLMQF